MRRSLACLLIGILLLPAAVLPAGASRAAAEVAPRHWAFVPPRVPPVPRVKNARWVRNPIDAFVLAELEKRGLAPNPPADRLTLLRRVTIDLTGLPPTPEEIAAFLADPTPNAYEKAVDRLLASPRYGERWAQHWLDVVRFAETNGFEADADRPQAWRYRDYVVDAFNRDLPYDRFLVEQIAGDELDPNDFRLRVATGFLRAGPQHVVGGNQEPEVNRQEWLTEAVTGIGAAVLGLTIQCARCHDHKYDPIPQADYYRLQAFFAAAENAELRSASPGEEDAYRKAVQAHRERLRPVQQEIAELERPYRERLRQQKLARLDPEYREALAVPEAKRTPEQKRRAQDAEAMLKIAWDELVAALPPDVRERRAALRKRMHAIELEAPEPLPAAQGVADTLLPPPPTRILVRGDVHTPGPEVQPGFPAVLAAGPARAAAPATLPPGVRSTGRRLALARWLARPDHPLTARVMVNRVWQHLFGRGIVATPNDFGRNGRPPTHPELLDWLALRFAGRIALPGEHRPAAWSLKSLIRSIVTSATYRQSAAWDSRKARLDPANRWLWRMNRRRLDAEAVRDSVLQAAGTLNLQMGGPSVRVPLEPEVYAMIFTEGEPDNLWPVTPDPRQHVRRSLYLLRKRNVRLPLFVVLDQPDRMTPCAAREQSVHALQALTLMNSDFMQEQSRALAGRVLREAPGETSARIQRLFLLTLARPPKPREMEATLRFLREQTALLRARAERGEPLLLPTGAPVADPAEGAAWVDLCLAMLNLNEFVYLS